MQLSFYILLINVIVHSPKANQKLPNNTHSFSPKSPKDGQKTFTHFHKSKFNRSKIWIYEKLAAKREFFEWSDGRWKFIPTKDFINQTDVQIKHFLRKSKPKKNRTEMEKVVYIVILAPDSSNIA
jgi:glutathione peroxidase-family protein